MNDKKLKKIEDEIVGMTIEMVGTVLGIEFHHQAWTDEQMKFFNNRIAEIRDRSIDKIRKVYSRKVTVKK